MGSNLCPEGLRSTPSQWYQRRRNNPVHCRQWSMPLRTSVPTPLNPLHQGFYQGAFLGVYHHRRTKQRTKQTSPPSFASKTSYVGAPPRTCCMKTYHISNLISARPRQWQQSQDHPRAATHPPAAGATRILRQSFYRQHGEVTLKKRKVVKTTSYNVSAKILAQQ